MKILIIEDEPSLMELMTRTLSQEKHVVECAADFASAQDKIAGYTYDCVLLDLNLPDGNGLDLLKILKSQKRKENVIIISARDAIEDRVLGLETGADDYLPKPFHLMELSARIRSVARRTHGDGQKGFSLGNVHLDTDSFRVFINDEEVFLLKKEFQILSYFMQRPNHIIDKSVLAEAVWGDYIDQSDNFHFVYTQVKNLRQKLISSQASIEIKSVYGFGYKLVINEEE